MTLEQAKDEAKQVPLPDNWQVEIGDILRPDFAQCLGVNFYTHDGETQRGLLRLIPWEETEPGCVTEALTLMCLDIALPPFSEMDG